MVQQKQQQLLDQWLESSRKVSRTIQIPQVTPTPMELTTLVHVSTLESMTPQPNELHSNQDGKNILMPGSPPTEPPKEQPDSEVNQPIIQSVLSEVVWPKRKILLEVSKETISQTQDMLAKYLLQFGDKVLKAIATSGHTESLSDQ